jgi:hypothetical protein
MLAGMDRNTMIVTLVKVTLAFAAFVVVVLRLDRLWLRLRKLQLRVGGLVKISARFFQQERHPPHLIYNMLGTVLLVPGDQLAIDHLIITHPDYDHSILIAPHHGRRSYCG